MVGHTTCNRSFLAADSAVDSLVEVAAGLLVDRAPVDWAPVDLRPLPVPAVVPVEDQDQAKPILQPLVQHSILHSKI